MNFRSRILLSCYGGHIYVIHDVGDNLQDIDSPIPHLLWSWRTKSCSENPTSSLYKKTRPLSFWGLLCICCVKCVVLGSLEKHFTIVSRLHLYHTNSRNLTCLFLCFHSLKQQVIHKHLETYSWWTIEHACEDTCSHQSCLWANTTFYLSHGSN